MIIASGAPATVAARTRGDSCAAAELPCEPCCSSDSCWRTQDSLRHAGAGGNGDGEGDALRDADTERDGVAEGVTEADGEGDGVGGAEAAGSASLLPSPPTAPPPAALPLLLQLPSAAVPTEALTPRRIDPPNRAERSTRCAGQYSSTSCMTGRASCRYATAHDADAISGAAPGPPRPGETTVHVICTGESPADSDKLPPSVVCGAPPSAAAFAAAAAASVAIGFA